jgi:general secretion pathway protein D
VGSFIEGIEINGVQFPSLAAVISAFDKNKGINIISTPQLLTTDNQEAKIFVGKNVPFQTTATTSDNDTFNSFEYRDVGVTLQLTPQITQDRLVRLEIFEEISKVESTEEFRPTTLNRSINTTVIARDNSTIVIGGLIDETYSETVTKVPLLGDIPVLGWLFKSKSTKRERTNLYLFLTPRVVKSYADAQALMDDTREEIDKMEMEELQKRKEEIEEKMDRRRKRMEEGNIKMYDKETPGHQPVSFIMSPDDEAM